MEDELEKRVTYLSPGGDYSGRDLSKTDLSRQDLRGCDFTRANLDRANLSHCQIDGAIFVEASLASADLRNIRGTANFARANLRAVDLSEAHVNCSWFGEADLRSASLFGARATGAQFLYANLEDADLRAALIRANFTGANCKNANMQKARLAGATVINAILSGVDFRGALLSSVYLTPKTIAGACFFDPEPRPVRAAAKPPRALNKITAYRGYQALLDELIYGRLMNETHPEGDFRSDGTWYPSELERAGGSGTSGRQPTTKNPMTYYARCRTKVHCRTLLLAALDGVKVPPDVAGVIERSVKILQRDLLASEDLARALVMALKNEEMRKALGI